MSNKRVLWVSGVALVVVILLGLAVLVVGRGADGKVQAQTTPAPDGYSGISVEGTGVILVKPDVVKLTVGMETRAATVGEAQKQSADKSDKVTEALKKAGIKPEDLKTTDYSIYPDYVYQQNQPPKLNGYIVRNTLSIVIRDTSKAGEVIDAAGAAGATQIGGISFTLENNADALKQARSAAMDNAKQKADQLATGGKVTVGSVIKIVEQSENVPVQPRQAAGAVAAPALSQTVIESGQFQVIVNVQVTYAINK